MATPPDTLRARLEDRADLLEAARLRYRALRGMLRGFFWRNRLRAHLELLREVARALPEVDEALGAVQRRAQAEGWPRDSAPRVLLAEVSSLRQALEREVGRRLEGPLPATLGEALPRLEEEVLAAGPPLAGRAWARAVELLPRNLPELRAACAAADVFQRVFQRPQPPDGALPFNAQEACALRQALPLADASLGALWARLEHFEPSGRVRALLERRARRAPVRPARSGPEQLLHALFWLGVARARLGLLLESRLAPVVPRAEEAPCLLEWLAAREDASTTRREPRLEACEAFGEGRAGLFEVAAELGALSRARPVGAWDEEVAWTRLWASALRARGERGEDVQRLREALRLFIRLRGQAHTPARLFSPERPPLPAPDVAEDVEDLPGLVNAARAAARGPPFHGRGRG